MIHILDSNGNIKMKVVSLTSTTIGSAIQAIGAGTQTLTGGTLIFSNANGVSFGLNGSTLTASAAGGGGGGAAVSFSAGTQSTTLGNLVFSNSNSVSFGLSNNTVTASFSAPAQSTQPVAISASNGSFAFSTVTFGNANGMSFLSSNGSIIGSYTVPTQSTQPVAVSGSNGSFAFSTLTLGSSNGLHFYSTNGSMVGSYTVPTITNSSATISAGTQSTTLGQLVFSNSNGLAFGLSNNTITGSYTVPSTAGLISAVNLSAGTTSNNLTAFTLSNSNGLAFGLNGSVVTGSYTVPTQSNQNISLYGLGNTTQNSSTVLNASNLSFNAIGSLTVGYSNGSIQLSAPNALTSQTNQTANLYVSGNTTQLSSTAGLDLRSISFEGAGVASVGVSNGRVLVSVPSGGGGGAAISAGTISQNTGTVNFANSNGITFGLSNNGTLTASHNGITSQTVQPVAISGSNGSFAFSTVTLGSSNGLHFYSTNGSIVGSYTVPTQSTQPVAVSGSNGSFTFSTLTLGSSNGMHFYSTNGSIVGSYTVPSTAGLISAVNLSAGTTSNNLSAFTLSNANGLSFGLNGSVVTASYTVPTQSNQNISLYALGNTTQNSSTVLNASNLSFNAIGSLTVGYSNGSIQLSAPNAITSQSNQNISFFALGNTTQNSSTVLNANAVSFNGLGELSVGFSNGSINFSANLDSLTAYATGNTTQSSSGGIAVNSLILNGAGNVSVGVSNGSVVISGGTAAASPVNFSAGTTSNNLGSVVFSNLNGVSFGLNGSTITASVNAGAGGGIALANSQTTYTSGTANLVVAGGAMTIASTTGQSYNFSVPATSSLSGTGQVSISVNGSTISIGVPNPYVSSYQNLPAINASSALTWNAASISHAAAFQLPEQGSFSFIRIPALMTTNSTTIATMASATATASGALYSTINAVIYSLGSGASSKSLQYVTSGAGNYTFSQRISVSNSTQGSYSLGLTAEIEGIATRTNLTTQYSISNTNYSFTTNQFTDYTSARFLDIPFAASLSAGPYWAIIGMSSSSASGGAAGLAALTNCNVRYSAHYGVSQAVLSIAPMGASNKTIAYLGAGSFSTAGGGTTNSLNVTQLSSMASNAMMYFQMLRSA